MYYHQITCTIDLLEAFRAYVDGKAYMARPKRRRTQRIGYGRDMDVTYIDHEMSHVDRLQEKLEKLKFVDEVCFNHQAWMTVSFETTNFKVAQRRLYVLKAKVDRIMRRWAAALPAE